MQNKKSLKIFFVTAADVEGLGAPRSIDVPMVKCLNDLGYNVSWFGINIDTCKDFPGEKTSLTYSKLQLFLIRLKNKVLRVLKIQTAEDQKLIAQQKFDKWMSRILEGRKNEIDKNLIYIGRGVSSDLSFQVIKKYGGRCVLHSQWMHPVEHSRILEGAFSDLDYSYKPIPTERSATQLREIDLCDQVWCISELVLDSYLKNGVPMEKLFLCPLGVDTNLFRPKEITSKEDVDQYSIVFVGNINIEKGVHILFEALIMAGISNYQLILNGVVADYFKPVLQNFSEALIALNVEVVIKSGFPLQNLQKADLFVLPSLHESFGLVVLEAMACGLPVIVTDQVGASGHVVCGENGFVVPANSAKNLSDKILYFYNNPDQQKIFGNKSYDLSQELGWPLIAQRFGSCIESAFND